ncbi:MAG: DUF2357 domain-containing protein [Clostridia bacterium]|nr:DUF2357 domain-containing protein [Clostridia bacterium]
MPDTPDGSRETTFRSIYDDTTFFIDNIIDEYDVYPTIIEKMRSGSATMELRKRYFLRAIDETWVNAIEEVLPALDQIIRNPSKFIEEKEELIPVELARKISARSLQHLAQHTNYIQSIKGDEITPSMLLNVYKDETLQTYENKFVNTLINRLFMFVNRRYEIALKAGQDEKTTSIDFKEDFSHDKIKVKMNFRIEISEPSSGLGDKVERNYSYTTDLWHRVEKLNSIIANYTYSEFCTEMGHSYIRPPVMRTNAILKNKNLRQCYELWQFIESYDSAGYSMLLQENLEQIDEGYIKEMYSTLAIQYMLFRYNIRNEFDFDSTLASSLSKEELKPHIVSELNNTSEHEFDIDDMPKEQEKTAKTPSEVRYSTMTPEDQIILESLDVAMEADSVINDRDESFLYSRGDIPEPEAVADDSPDAEEIEEPEKEEPYEYSPAVTAAVHAPERFVSDTAGMTAEDHPYDAVPEELKKETPEEDAAEEQQKADSTAGEPDSDEKKDDTFDYEDIIRRMYERIESANAAIHQSYEPEQEETPDQKQTPEASDTETDNNTDNKEEKEFLSNLKFPFEDRSEDNT